MIASAPYFHVLNHEVLREAGEEIVVAIFLHEGKVFRLRFEASDALALSGELEQAYQQNLESQTEGQA